MGFYVSDKVDSGLQNPGINGGKTISAGVPQLAAVDSSNLEHRTLLGINPEGGDVFWGFNEDVTSTPGITNSGLRIGDGTTENFSFIGDTVDGVDIWVVPASGSVTVNFAESAKLPEVR